MRGREKQDFCDDEKKDENPGEISKRKVEGVSAIAEKKKGS